MINIVVPMAGRGSRFAGSEENTPKPLIEVEPGKRMIEYVIDYLTLPEPHRFIFVCLEHHHRRYDFHGLFRPWVNDYQLVLTNTVTSGPAASALLAKDFVDNDSELLIAYCDCFFTVHPSSFVQHARRHRADGALIIYPSDSALDAYAEIDGDGRVVRTAEKEIISTTAAAGFYYFREGRDYVAAAGEMIATAADHRVEFFVCPAYNELIRQGKTVVPFLIERDQKIEMGTREDLARSRQWLMDHGSRSEPHIAGSAWQ